MDATHVSDRLFGRPCRLPVAAWIIAHDKGRFFQSEPPRFGKTSGSNIAQELERFAQLGMLDVERPDDSNKVYYVRTDSPLWRIIEVAVEVTGLRWEGPTLHA
jgi:hypothetical protein